MAKILRLKSANDMLAMFTLSRPQVGQKLLFLSDETTDGLFIAYQDGPKLYANGIKCLIYDENELRPHVVPVSDFTAASIDPIENTFYPQLKHEITKKIAVYGKKAVQSLANEKSVATVGGTYSIKVKSSKKDDYFYNWITLGLDATDERYKETKEKITFGGAEIKISECLKFFDNYEKEQNERLQRR